MSFTLHLPLCFLALIQGLIDPGPAQSQSVPSPTTSPETRELDAALVRTGSEEEQERLLARYPGLTRRLAPSYGRYSLS